MLTLKKVFICLVAISVLLAAIGGLTPSSAQGSRPAEDVNVVNTPVVQAQQAGPWTVGAQLTPGSTVGITGTPTVSISGTPTVNVSNLPPVTVLNTPLPVREVGVPEPFQARIPVSVDGPSNSGQGSLTVPPGKRLVIEYFSATGGLNANQMPAIWALKTTTHAVEVTHGAFRVDRAAALGLEYAIDPWVGNISEGRSVRIYADPNTRVTCEVAISVAPPTGASNLLVCYVSGYLVDVP